MATSSFGKQFTVQQEKATDFVEEMVKAVAPTLRGAFQSRFANLSQDKDLKTAIRILEKHISWLIVIY